MEYNSGRRIKNYLQLRCNVGMRLWHHGVFIGLITLLITVGFRRNPHTQPSTPTLKHPNTSTGQDLKSVCWVYTDYLIQETASELWEQWGRRKIMCERMKISNLDANNIRSFDRVQAVMLRSVMCWCEWGQVCELSSTPGQPSDQEDSPKLLFQYHLGPSV